MVPVSSARWAQERHMPPALCQAKHSEYKIGDAFHLHAGRAICSLNAKAPDHRREEAGIIGGVYILGKFSRLPGLGHPLTKRVVAALAHRNHCLLDRLRILATGQHTLDREAAARMIRLGEE